MLINPNIEIDVPAGFYCRKCPKLKGEKNWRYCGLWGLNLAEDSKRRLLKCRKCILAEREARSKL